MSMSNIEIYRADENHFLVQYNRQTTAENLQEVCNKKLQSMGFTSNSHYLAITTAKAYKDKSFYNTRKLSNYDKIQEIKESYSLSMPTKIYLLDQNLIEKKKSTIDSAQKESELTYAKIKARGAIITR
jgi:hypothetical protein